MTVTAEHDPADRLGPLEEELVIEVLHFIIIALPAIPEIDVMILGGGAGVFHYSSLRSKVTGIRFSPATCVVMLTASLVFIWANVRPSTTDEPVLHDFGFPLRYLRLAIQHGEQLEYYMGYSLGWQLDQMMLNVLLAGVLILTAGVAIESITERAVLNPRPDR